MPIDDYLSNLSNVINREDLFGVDPLTRMSNIRMQNDTNMYPTPDEGLIDDDTYTAMRMRELYHPDSRFETRYEQLLNEMPVRTKPGVASRIFAGLAGAGGDQKLAEQIKYGGYLRNLDDWELRRKALEPALQYERASNINERQLADMQLRNELANRKEARITAYGKRKQDIEEKKLALNEFKATHPNWIMKETKGGNYMMFNPQTQEAVDTGIATGTLSDIEKQKYGLEKALAVTAAQGKNAQQLEAARQANKMAIIKHKEANPNYKFVTAKGGNVWAINPLVPDDIIDTGVESGTLTEEDKIELGIIGKKELAQIQQENATASEEQKQKNRIQLEGVKTAGRKEVKKTPSPGTNTKPNPPATSKQTKDAGKTDDKTPPPIEKRTIGMKWTFANGNVGQWNGKIWVPLTVVKK